MDVIMDGMLLVVVVLFIDVEFEMAALKTPPPMAAGEMVLFTRVAAAR